MTEFHWLIGKVKSQIRPITASIDRLFRHNVQNGCQYKYNRRHVRVKGKNGGLFCKLYLSYLINTFVDQVYRALIKLLF